MARALEQILDAEKREVVANAYQRAREILNELESRSPPKLNDDQASDS